MSDLHTHLSAATAQPPAAPVETATKSAPLLHSSLPSGESGSPVMAASGGADARCSAGNAEVIEARRLLAAEDARQDKLQEILETIREQIRLEIKPENRPDGLFKNIQDAVYAMRGRTRLMDDAAITHVLDEPQPTQVTADQAAEDVRREREAKAERDRYAKMTTAEKCAVQGDGFINDYD